MLKNPIVLVAVAALVAGGVWLLFSQLRPVSDLQPLTPSPGESPRRQGVPPKPVRADPRQALASLEMAGAVLPQGDVALRELLRAALAAKEDPTWRAALDIPFSDNAAQQVSDEVREWIARKMAGLGFGDATAKPTVLWKVHIDPANDGRYTLKTALRAGGETRHEQSFELPAAYTTSRMNDTLAPGFGAPLAAPAAPGSMTP
ncbi:MAG: hypothetical protein HY901_35800 [Deltaproteobacteria bacterium]|nr:hypothetical protein [Deltaproteobacteria bacterium]